VMPDCRRHRKLSDGGMSKSTAKHLSDIVKLGRRQSQSILSEDDANTFEPFREDKIAYDRAHQNAVFFELISHRRTVRLELKDLDFEEIRMLITVDLHAHEDDFPDILIKGILEMTNGNPYWCKELAQFIIIRGQEEFLKSPKDAFQTVVLSKVSRLTAEQQCVLKTAAVMGEEFYVEMLHLSLPKQVSVSLIDSLMYLADHNFITRFCSDPLIYAFPNVRIRNILVQMIPPRWVVNYLLLFCIF
jgi:predicted ATPase